MTVTRRLWEASAAGCESPLLSIENFAAACGAAAEIASRTIDARVSASCWLAAGFPVVSEWPAITTGVPDGDVRNRSATSLTTCWPDESIVVLLTAK